MEKNNLLKMSKRPFVWLGVRFRSKQEMECAKIILNKPIYGINCDVKVSNKRIDFYPNKNDKMFKNCFVEFHITNNFLHPGETSENYYLSRRKTLDDNGYANKKLIIISSLKQLNKT